MRHFAARTRIARKLMVVVATITTLAGCASTSSVADRPLVASGVKNRTGIDAASLPAPKEWTAPPGTSIADGLTMDEAVAIALWNNAAFQAALASLGIARADVVQAGMLKNPMLSLLFPLGPKQFEAVATIAIDAMWQRPRRIADARLNAEAVAETLVHEGLQLVADVKLAYVEVIAADRPLELAAEQAATVRQLADLAAGQLRAGDISAFEAGIARTAATQWEAARLSRMSERDLALVRLRSLLDLPFDAPPLTLLDALPTPVAAAGCGDVAALMKTAMAARPDVRAAELQIDAAGARAGLERAKIISLTAALDMNGAGTEGFEMGPGITVELPILSQNQGGRARAAADLEQASRRYLAVRAGVSADVQSAFVTLTQARNTAALFDAAVGESLTASRRQAQALHDAGEISMLALLETRRRLYDVELARVDSLAAAARATVRLDRAVGRSCGRN